MKDNGTKESSIKYLLGLIKDADECIESSQKIGSELMVRQYKFMKNKYVKELLEMLREYRISPEDFQMAAA